MSSAVQSALTSLQQNDYVSLVMLTTVGYDYDRVYLGQQITACQGDTFLITPQNKPWTWVSMLFIPNCFCCCELTYAVFILVIFMDALKVKSLLPSMHGYLSPFLFQQIIIFTLLASAFNSDPRYLSEVTTIQLLNFSFCAVQPTTLIWMKMATILQITHSAMMCILAIVQFGRQSLQMYCLTKQWQSNRYLILLSHPFPVPAPLPSKNPDLPTGLTITFRRRGEGIGTGFGLSLSGRDAVGTAIVFTDVQQNGRSEDVEEIPMEVATTQANYCPEAGARLYNPHDGGGGGGFTDYEPTNIWIPQSISHSQLDRAILLAPCEPWPPNARNAAKSFASLSRVVAGRAALTRVGTEKDDSKGNSEQGAVVGHANFAHIARERNEPSDLADEE
ncbi:hypothetical protein OG21DRAFT_1525726 [Imleria badia]|nr:hypothetical protein OG21DRAFT_1525726 [Imleria badia]